MRQTIAYIISAAMHLALIAVIIPSNVVSEADIAIALPEQLTINWQEQAPSIVETETTPIPVEKVQEVQKITKTPSIKKTPISTPIEKKLIKTEKTQTDKPLKKQQKKEITPSVAAVNQEIKTAPVVEKKAPVKTVLKPQVADVNKDTNETSVIHNPTYQKQRPIKYPRSAKRKKLQGIVIIRATIDPNGFVKKAWVHESSGHSILDRSAINSIKGWIFTPAQQDNSPITSTVQFPIAFKLK